MAPDLVEAFVGEFNAEVNRQAQRPLRGRVDREKPLAKVCCRIDDLVEAVADGRRFPTLREQLECLEDEKVSLLQRSPRTRRPCSASPKPLQPLPRPDSGLHTALTEPSIRDTAIDILRQLIDDVIVRSTEAGQEVALVGGITRMIELSAATESSVLGPKVYSAKLVAGARNQLDLLLVARGLEEPCECHIRF